MACCATLAIDRFYIAKVKIRQRSWFNKMGQLSFMIKALAANKGRGLKLGQGYGLSSRATSESHYGF